MNEQEVNEAWQALHANSGPEIDGVMDQVEPLLAMLPDDAAWIVRGAFPNPRLYAVNPTGPLYCVRIDLKTAGQDENSEVVLVSEPLRDELSVSLKLGERVQYRDEFQRRAAWEFGRQLEPGDEFGDWQRVTGSVRDGLGGPADRDEHFARVIASRAGWRFDTPAEPLVARR